MALCLEIGINFLAYDCGTIFGTVKQTSCQFLENLVDTQILFSTRFSVGHTDRRRITIQKTCLW